MAKINDLPMRHRGYASRIKPKVLEALSTAELRHRVAYAAGLHEAAASQPPEQYRHLTGKARKILNSEPAWEHVDRLRRWADLASQASRRVEVGEGGKFHSIAGDIEHGAAEHRAKHEYPPGLLDAIGAHYSAERLALS
jgi:hypothetical protein